MADNRRQTNTLHNFPTEAVHRASDIADEAMRGRMQALAEGQHQFAQNAAEQFATMSQMMAQAIQSTTEGMREFMVLPNTTKSGLQDLQQGVTGLFAGIMRTNVRATQELFSLYNPSAVVELQQRFARAYLDTFLEGSATLVRAARRTADETLRPLEQQVEQRRQARQDEQR